MDWKLRERGDLTSLYLVSSTLVEARSQQLFFYSFEGLFQQYLFQREDRMTHEESSFLGDAGSASESTEARHKGAITEGVHAYSYTRRVFFSTHIIRGLWLESKVDQYLNHSMANELHSP